MKLQASQTLTKADEKQDSRTEKSRKARTNASMRMQLATASKSSTTSPTLEALNSAAKELGLDKSQTQEVEKLAKNPTAFAKGLEGLLGSGSLDSLPELSSSDKALLGKVLGALENGSAADVLKAVGVSKEQADTITKLISNNDASKGPESYLDAISAADAALSQVISTVSKNSADLTQLHMESQNAQSNNLTHQLSYFKEQCDHIVHEINKAHKLSILKKVFGYLVAAILAIVAVALARPSLLLVAIVVIVSTASPKFISNTLNSLVRDLGIKGPAAEAITVVLKAVIAVALAIASGGSGGITALGAMGMAGAAAGTFAMEGGVENVAYLEADAQDGGDLRKTDPDSDKVKKYEALGQKITMGVSIGCGAASVIGSLPQIMESATTMVNKVSSYLKALSNTAEEGAESTGGAATTVAANAAEEVADTAETVSNSASKSTSTSGESAMKTAFKKTVEFLQKNGENIKNISQAGNNGIQGVASILIGIAMIELAGFQQNVGNSNANLHQAESMISQESQSFRKDASSTQATTTQSIEQLFTETNTEQRAFEGQVVGNVAGL
ncbi:MAG: hypothetical protein CME32_05640 [Gimesia sp.]|nr:hypothetical protein [Gimesia sp.]